MWPDGSADRCDVALFDNSQRVKCGANGVGNVTGSHVALGQKTGWASRNHDGAIASGTHGFRPGRFEGGMTMAQVIGGAR